jgi:hypothetical protein
VIIPFVRTRPVTDIPAAEARAAETGARDRHDAAAS